MKTDEMKKEEQDIVKPNFASRTVKLVLITDLKKAGWNPPKRIKRVEGSKLYNSIKEIGLQYPVIATKDNRLIDGHRRVAVCEALGWEEIPVLISTVEDVDKAYADINSTPMRMDGNDMLYIFFENPKALTGVELRRCQKALHDLGEKLLRAIHKSGTTLVVHTAAVSLAKYCSQNRNFIPKAVRWFLNHGSVTAMNQAKANDTPPSILIDAVLKRKPLRFRTDIQD